MLPSRARSDEGLFAGFPEDLLSPESRLYSVWRADQVLMCRRFNGYPNGYVDGPILDGDVCQTTLNLAGVRMSYSGVSTDRPLYDAAHKAIYIDWQKNSHLRADVDETVAFTTIFTDVNDADVPGMTCMMQFRHETFSGQTIQGYMGNKHATLGGGWYLRWNEALSISGNPGLELVTFTAASDIGASSEMDRVEYEWTRDNEKHWLSITALGLTATTVDVKVYLDGRAIISEVMTRASTTTISKESMSLGSEGPANASTRHFDGWIYGYCLAGNVLSQGLHREALRWIGRARG